MHPRQDIDPYSWLPSSLTFTFTYSTDTSGDFGYPYTEKTVELKKENGISQDEFDEIF